MTSNRPGSNKLVAAVAVILLGGLVALVASVRPKAQAFEPNPEPATSIQIVQCPYGRVLYVVVDFDGVYLGEVRIDPAIAKEVVNNLLKAQKIRNLVIYGTTQAQVGAAVDIFANLDLSVVRWRTLDHYALPVGTRKPLTGYLEPMCCGSYDSENDPPEP